jgi:hypothetical protein
VHVLNMMYVSWQLTPIYLKGFVAHVKLVRYTSTCMCKPQMIRERLHSPVRHRTDQAATQAAAALLLPLAAGYRLWQAGPCTPAPVTYLSLCHASTYAMLHNCTGGGAIRASLRQAAPCSSP